MSKRTILIDGRELVIIDESTKKYRFVVIDSVRVDLVDRIIEAAIAVCKTSKYAKHFPRIEIRIKDKHGSMYGSYLGVQHEKQLFNVHLFNLHNRINRLLALNRSLNAYPDFEHELAHLYHEQVSRYLSIDRIVFDRTYAKAVTAIPRYKVHFRKWYAELREDLQIIFRNMLSEGIATYVQKFGGGDIIFEEDKFKWFHNRAIKYAEILALKFKEIVDEKDSPVAEKKASMFLKDGRVCPYHIGLHMVYTILYFNKDMTLEDIFKMNKYHKFVRLYAETMLVNGKKPIVVSTTGKFNAIIDYNQMLAELMAAYERNTRSGNWLRRLWK